MSTEPLKSIYLKMLRERHDPNHKQVNEADIFQKALVRGVHKLGRWLVHGSKQSSVGRIGKGKAIEKPRFQKPMPWGAPASTSTGPKIPTSPPRLGMKAQAAQQQHDLANRSLQALRQRAQGRAGAKSDWMKTWGPEGIKTKELTKTHSQANPFDTSQDTFRHKDHSEYNSSAKPEQPATPSRMSVYDLRKMRKHNSTLKVRAKANEPDIGKISGQLQQASENKSFRVKVRAKRQQMETHARKLLRIIQEAANSRKKRMPS
jgi:hypothetical protein